MKSKVNLFIIGVSKCGTTSLWHMLNSHPGIFMSTPKEPWYFSFSDYMNRMDWYESLFQDVNDEKYLGEASPIYSETTLIPDLPKRIYNYNPNAKIIYIVREPVDRIKSVWRQTLSSGHQNNRVYRKYTDVYVPLMSDKFEEAIFTYPPFIEACKYWTHINSYRQYFDDENILLLFFEDLKSTPQSVYKKICQFLKIETIESEKTYEKQNSSLGKTMYPKWYSKLKFNRYSNKLLNPIIDIFKIEEPKIKIDYNILIHEDIKKRIFEILESEITQILTYGNKPKEYWDK